MPAGSGLGRRSWKVELSPHVAARRAGSHPWLWLHPPRPPARFGGWRAGENPIRFRNSTFGPYPPYHSSQLPIPHCQVSLEFSLPPKLALPHFRPLVYSWRQIEPSKVSQFRKTARLTVPLRERTTLQEWQARPSFQFPALVIATVRSLIARPQGDLG